MAPVEPDNHDHQDGTVGPLPGEIWSCFGPVLGGTPLWCQGHGDPPARGPGPQIGLTEGHGGETTAPLYPEPKFWAQT